MTGLVLYRSHYGTTRQLAEEIGRVFAGTGMAVTVQDVRSRMPALDGVGIARVGGPTRMARADLGSKRALRRLARRRYAGKVVIFDTYGPVPTDPSKLEESRKWTEPGAAGKLFELAVHLELNVYDKTLRCEAAGIKGPLKEGEKEKAVEFARAVAGEIV